MKMQSEELTALAELPKELYEEENSSQAALLVIYGTHIGKSYFLGPDEQIIGRSERADILIDQDSVSREHARIKPEMDGYSVQDLGSTNGTFVNGQKVESALLKDGDRLHVGETILKFLTTCNLECEYHEKVYRMMTIDDLTQAYNRQHFLASLNREINRVQRYHRVFSLVICDLDDFKPINDNYGHGAGDYVLKEFVSFVRRKIRRNDMICRYGGDEFAIILPETNREQALYFCEKLRAMVQEHEFHYQGAVIPVTVSVGVKHFEPGDGEMGARQLIAEADKKLYEAKKRGRNCVRG
ncbi:MAG: diguanylate cyclase [Desulfobacterales bacterium]